jgi:threonyl-tRNA synthetase
LKKKSQLEPGNVFFLPHGARIFNRLQRFLRDEYRARGYEEVITPLIFNTALWKQSGHYDNYKDDMFTVISSSHKTKETDKSEYMLKPMNCPGNALPKNENLNKRTLSYF